MPEMQGSIYNQRWCSTKGETMREALVGRIAFGPMDRRKFMTGAAVGAVGVSVVGLEGCPSASQWFNIAIADLPTILQVVGGIVAIAENPAVVPELEAKLKQYAAEATKDLNTAKDLITQYKGTATDPILTKIDDALLDAQKNLGDLLAAFHVSDPTLMATVSAAVGLGITTIIAIQAAVPAPSTAPAARKDLARNNGANAIKRAYNFIVIKNYPNAVIA
jgi:hypothetical protein